MITEFKDYRDLPFSETIQNELFKRHRHGDDIAPEEIVYTEKSVLILMQMLAAELLSVMEWVKIEEQTPNKNRGLIVWNGVYIYDDVQVLDNGEFWTHTGGYDYDSFQVKNVTHWMYLPMPPSVG